MIFKGVDTLEDGLHRGSDVRIINKRDMEVMDYGFEGPMEIPAGGLHPENGLKSICIDVVIVHLKIRDNININMTM